MTQGGFEGVHNAIFTKILCMCSVVARVKANVISLRIT